jgi:hypothetical protein
LPLSYQWFKDGTALGGATNNVYSIANVSTNDAGNYSVRVTNLAGSTTSQVATLTVLVPPSIIGQPQSLSLNYGKTAIFSVSATGTLPLSYQWYKDGAAIRVATTDIQMIPNLETNNAGNYTVVVSNVAGSATSQVAVLTVLVPPTILSILSTNAVVVQGDSTNFTVSATGTPPLSYQWRKEGMNLRGAAGAVYPLVNVQTNNAGNYSVVIKNVAGSATSQVVVLTVLVPPTILSIMPTNAVIVRGAATNFTVSAIGTPPLSYQWRKEGMNLRGGTGAVYPLVNAQTNSAGNYSVVITNIAGSATSQVAVLTVLPPPIIPLSIFPASQSPYGWIIRFEMNPNNIYIVQKSGDLTKWDDVETNECAEETIHSFVERNAFAQGNRFYRIWVRSKVEK